MVHEMVSGERPFRGGTTGELPPSIEPGSPGLVGEPPPDVPRPLVRLIDRCLRARREERPADGGAVVVELEAVLAALEPVGRRGRYVGLAALAALAVAGGVTAWLVFRPAPRGAAALGAP